VTARLITVPFSHFCEKARWALDHAQVDYVEEGHVPGFHRLAVWRSGSTKSSVPVLIADGAVLGDSSDILAWADTKAAAERGLYPKDEATKREVVALEDRLDEELGPNIRRVLYFHILPRPRLAFDLMDQRTPFWQRAALRVGFPFLFFGMRRFMIIDARTAEESRGHVLRLLDTVDALLADGRRFLVGDRLTAADVTLASLAGPAVMPAEHSVRFPSPKAFPAPAADLLRDVQARPVADYIRRMYALYRYPDRQAAVT
jgi:glutathione S-transferase